MCCSASTKRPVQKRTFRDKEASATVREGEPIDLEHMRAVGETMITRDMTPAQLVAYDAIDKLEVVVSRARYQMENGDFNVETMRMMNLVDRIDEALVDE